MPLLRLGFSFMPKDDLDAIDCRIVATLQADGRLSNIELAARVGLSPSPCLRRVKRLERDGYIDAYRAVLQRERIGLGFSVFIGVKIEGHANDQALAFEKAVLAMPEVVGFHLVSGEVDYFLEVVVPDLEHYRQFLITKLLELPIGEVERGHRAHSSTASPALLISTSRTRVSCALPRVFSTRRERRVRCSPSTVSSRTLSDR